MTIYALHDAGNVIRFHTVRTIKQTTVAHHSWGVCLILAHICDPSANLLKAALYHDLAESVTGDVPATAKWRSPQLCSALASLEAEFDRDNNLTAQLTEHESYLLKWADMYELVLYAESEILMGNQLFKPILRRGLDYLNQRPAPTLLAQQLLKETGYVRDL